MAALCGPSNALTNLQKHATADRSFHQDRFRAGPSQAGPGFRSSTPGPSGWVENDFETFASGAPLAHESLNAQPQQQPSWANDFQRLKISPQEQQQRFATPPPMQMQQPAWGLEFMQRLQQRPEAAPATAVAAPQQSYLTDSPSYMGMNQAYGPSMGLGMSSMAMTQNHQPVQSSAEDFGFSASAFEQAFAEAEREVLGEKPAFDIPESWVAEPPVEEEKEKEPSAQDGDALARTAGQLLDSVQENRSAKFQKSNFLALMRKIRDHEVVVEGDKMVETHS